jgi:putative intracellular protease/amidase
MPRIIGILLFDGAEEMDFVGPWEVFTASLGGVPGDRVVTIAERSRPITCKKGMRVIPDLTYEEATTKQSPLQRARRARADMVAITLSPPGWTQSQWPKLDCMTN